MWEEVWVAEHEGDIGFDSRKKVTRIGSALRSSRCVVGVWVKVWIAEHEGDIWVDSKKRSHGFEKSNDFSVWCVLGGRKFRLQGKRATLGLIARKGHTDSKSLTTFLCCVFLVKESFNYKARK